MTEQEAIEVLLKEVLKDDKKQNNKIFRLFQMLYFLSIILTPTIIGALVGIPLFIILVFAQYIIFGNANPNFVFKFADKIILQRFITVCWALFYLSLLGYILVIVFFGVEAIPDSSIFVGAVTFYVYAVYIFLVGLMLLGYTEGLFDIVISGVITSSIVAAIEHFFDYEQQRAGLIVVIASFFIVPLLYKIFLAAIGIGKTGLDKMVDFLYPSIEFLNKVNEKRLTSFVFKFLYVCLIVFLIYVFLR